VCGSHGGVRRFLCILWLAALSVGLVGCQPIPPARNFNPAILQPGDLMLYAPVPWRYNPADAAIGRLIVDKTGRYKSHAGVFWGYTNGHYISFAARIDGVNYYPTCCDATLACVRRVPGTFNRAAADAAVKGDVGKPYEIPGLFAFFDPWRVPHHVIRVCSPMATKYVRGGGLDPLNPDCGSELVAPGDLFTSGKPVTIWRNATIDRVQQPALAGKQSQKDPGSILTGSFKAESPDGGRNASLSRP
jgi:hypothetical protein